MPAGWSFTFAGGPLPYDEIVQNLLLFIPLGVALAWAGVRPFAAIAIGTALSISVEFVQQWLPGRDPSVGDIVCNLASTGIGVALVRTAPRWLIVPPRRAAWQSCAAAAAAAAVWLALGAELPPGSSVGEGWKLIFYSDRIPVWLRELADAGWIAMGWLPIGFWARRHFATGLAIVVAAFALLIAPPFVEATPTPVAELLAGLLGFAAGLALRRLSPDAPH